MNENSERASWNTIQPKPKPTRSYSANLTLTFALTAIMTASILVCVLAFVWEGQFAAYTRHNMQKLADATAQALSDSYAQEGQWNEVVLLNARSASSMSMDIGIEVVNAAGLVLYNDSVLRTSGDLKTLTELSITSSAPKNTDAVVQSAVYASNGDLVGYVRIWAFGSDALLTKSDITFRKNSYIAIATAAGIATVLACTIGYVASRSLTKPIQRITATAKQLRNGDMTARSKVRGTDEIGQLGETFDDMANTLERDLKLEHRLTGDVAHELRTPLMAMLATVEAMQDGVLPADDEHFETVASEVRRLSRLVDAMLRLSRLENSTTDITTEKTDLVYMVKSLVSSQYQLFKEKQIHLRFVDESSHGELFAEVDPDLIREAIVNLMSNALRYTNTEGWVTVTCAQKHDNALIAVQDTGIGIAKDDISQTLSRFWRSDVSRERESGGLGVGLAITKEIIDKHNGIIHVESELNKGSTFTLSIPLAHRKVARG